jgi:hypothetical protein
MGQDERPTDSIGRPVNAMHAGGRALYREAVKMNGLSPTMGRKNSPERLRRLLGHLMKFPHVTHATAFVGISYTTLKYWLKRSEKGQPGDGFDLEYGEETKRFHLHFDDVREAAVQMVEDAYFERAIHGYYEVLSDKGRVIYQRDPQLEALGYEGPDAYLLDEDGRPIPERIHHQDPEVMLSVLRQWRRDRWGLHANVDHKVHGGVLVVHDRAPNSLAHEAEEKALLSSPIDVEFEDIETDE